MKTGIEWYEYQIALKEKQLKIIKDLYDIHKNEGGVDIEQMIYDDQQYLAMLRYGLRNMMDYKDYRD